MSLPRSAPLVAAVARVHHHQIVRVGEFSRSRRSSRSRGRGCRRRRRNRGRLSRGARSQRRSLSSRGLRWSDAHRDGPPTVREAGQQRRAAGDGELRRTARFIVGQRGDGLIVEAEVLGGGDHRVTREHHLQPPALGADGGADRHGKVEHQRRRLAFLQLGSEARPNVADEDTARGLVHVHARVQKAGEQRGQRAQRHQGAAAVHYQRRNQIDLVAADLALGLALSEAGFDAVPANGPLGAGAGSRGRAQRLQQFEQSDVLLLVALHHSQVVAGLRRVDGNALLLQRPRDVSP